MLDDFREWLSDNLRYILLGLAVLLIAVIVFCVIRLVTSGSSGNSSQNSGTAESEISTESVTEPSEQGETAAEGTESLVKDDTAILTLVRQYYTAAAAKDITALATIVEPWDDEVQDSILQSNVIENYENVSTYSKKGSTDGSYVVYAYYDGKVSNIDTLVPSLAVLYLVTGENGSLVVYSDRQEVADYISSVSEDADVRKLVSDVNKLYEEALASDPALEELMASLSGSNSDSGETSGTGEVSASGEMTAAAQLNIRQEASTESAIMGVIPEGTVITVLQDAGDGWVQISYNAGSYTIEGYVRLEYLTSTGTDTTQTSETTAETAAGTTDTGTGTADAGTADAGSGANDAGTANGSDGTGAV